MDLTQELGNLISSASEPVLAPIEERVTQKTQETVKQEMRRYALIALGLVAVGGAVYYFTRNK